MKKKLALCVAAAVGCAAVLLCSCDDSSEYKQAMREIKEAGKVYRRHADEADELISYMDGDEKWQMVQEWNRRHPLAVKDNGRFLQIERQ